VRDRPRLLLHQRPRSTTTAAAAMSFLFGKKSKQQANNALPPATREITSSGGPGQPPPAVNGSGSREIERTRGGSQSQTPTPGGSINNSLSSLQNQTPGNAPTPEPKALREKADTNIQVRCMTSPLCCMCADCHRIRTPDLPATHQTPRTLGPPDG
jgi:hypothetical protein